jgi:hypothetical protein
LRERIEKAPGEFAEPIEMGLEVADEIFRKINIQQGLHFPVFQEGIGAEPVGNRLFVQAVARIHGLSPVSGVEVRTIVLPVTIRVKY